MHTDQTSSVRALLCFVWLLGFLPFQLKAEISEYSNFKISYRDSLMLEEGGHIISTTVRITNVIKKDLAMGVVVRLPEYWRIIGRVDQKELSTFLLKPGETKSFTLSLLHTSRVKAGWDSICLAVSSYATNPKYHSIAIHVNEKPEFQFQALNDELEFSKNAPDIIFLTAKLKNTGNNDDTYRISADNTTFNFHVEDLISLPPGGDTTLKYKIQVKDKVWKYVSFEMIPLTIKSDRIKKMRSIVYKVKKVNSYGADPLPTRKEIPFTIGGGLLVNGDKITYFGQINAQVTLGQHSFNLGYRTQDLGTVVNSYQPNAFNFGYSYKHFQIAAGQIQGPLNFYTFGQGARLRYNKQNTTFTIAAIRHNDARYMNNNHTFENDNIYSELKYKISNIQVEQRLESNFNKYYGLNSYILSNEVGLLNSQATRLKLFGGLGYEEKTKEIVGISKLTAGWSAGYELNTKWKTWVFNSEIKYRSSRFPGIFQGLHYETHEIRKNFYKIFLNGTFRLNSIQHNTLRDTLYNSDYLSTNNIKYGVGIGLDAKKIMPWIGFGVLVQQGAQYSFNGAYYVDATLSYKFSNYNLIELNSNNALFKNQGSGMFGTNTQFRASSKHFALSAIYSKTPQSGEYSNIYVETINAGPSCNYSFFNNSFQFTLRYAVAKTMTESMIRNGFGGQISYGGRNNGLVVGLNGFYPLKDPSRLDLPISEIRSANLYLLKRFNIPLSKRHMHSMKVVLFIDDNNNGNFDIAEKVLSDVFMNINANPLITDDEGMVSYKNLRLGPTRISFLNSNVGKLIPTRGIVQIIDLQKDEQLFIPFREGRKIFGNIRVINDSLSRTALTPDNFKVIITDTSGQSYFALSDRLGNFSVYLPEDAYKVSLNTDVFVGTDFMPKQSSFNVTLQNESEAFVQFTIIQKKRKIRFLDTSKK